MEPPLKRRDRGETAVYIGGDCWSWKDVLRVFFFSGGVVLFASLKKIEVSFNRFSNLRAFATQGPLVFWGVLQMICELRCLMSPSKTETTRRKNEWRKKQETWNSQSKYDITSIFFEPGEEGSLAHVAIGRFFDHLPNFNQKGVKSFAAVPWPHWEFLIISFDSS